MKVLSKSTTQLALRGGSFNTFLILGLGLLCIGFFAVYIEFGSLIYFYKSMPFLIATSMSTIFILSAEKITAYFDKTSNNGMIHNKRLIKGTSKSFSLSNIAGVEEIEKMTTNSKGHRTYSYELYLVFKDQSSLYIGPTKTINSRFLPGRREVESIGNELGIFLGVPYTFNEMPNLDFADINNMGLDFSKIKNVVIGTSKTVDLTRPTITTTPDEFNKNFPTQQNTDPFATTDNKPLQ